MPELLTAGCVVLGVLGAIGGRITLLPVWLLVTDRPELRIDAE